MPDRRLRGWRRWCRPLDAFDVVEFGAAPWQVEQAHADGAGRVRRQPGGGSASAAAQRGGAHEFQQHPGVDLAAGLLPQQVRIPSDRQRGEHVDAAVLVVLARDYGPFTDGSTRFSRWAW